jgi:hypothetical protein
VAFFTSAGLDALALGAAALLELALLGVALDAGLAVGFTVGLAADFLAEDLEGIVSFAAEEREIWRQFTH